MKRTFIDLYKALFVRKSLYQFHYRLLNISLWGLGILNSENFRLSGEDHFLRHLGEIADIKNRLVVLDVGANTGQYANKVKLLHSQAEIFAFEPARSSFKTLSDNSNTYGYKAFNVALSNVSGHASFYNRKGDSSEHASLFREVLTEIHDDQDLICFEVPVSTVDEFARQQQLQHIHLLKIDAEGSEMNVLRGAQRMLEARAIDVIQFEFNTMNVISRVFMKDFYTLLTGYKLYRLLPDGFVLLNPTPSFISEVFAFQNIIAIRDECHRG